jgi:hypothetical protein
MWPIRSGSHRRLSTARLPARAARRRSQRDRPKHLRGAPERRRQSLWRFSSLRPLKDKRPDLVINLMGCLVGVKNQKRRRSAFPYVDVFSPPSDPRPLVAYLPDQEVREMEETATNRAALRPGWRRTGCCPKEQRQPGVGFHPDCVWLLACLHLLHHPLPPRDRAQPPARRDPGRGALVGGPGRQRDHPAGPDRRPLWQRRAHSPT